jgi:integrase
MVDDFADDILAAWAENQRLRTRARQATPTTETRAALDTYLDGLAARGLPLPTQQHAGQPATAITYIAAITGASTEQVATRLKAKKWKEYRARLTGPCPLHTQIRGRIDGRPWTEAIDFTEAAGLMRHLGTACFIVLSYLTGQRPGETLGLRAGCCPEPDDGRPLIYGHVFKTARDEDGNHRSQGQMREVPWVAIPPAMHAIRVLERMVPADSLLFDATTHDYSTHRTYPGALNRPTMSRRVEDFITWASALATRSGRPHEVIPDDPYGAVGTERFRRTLAWHIARRPGGLVALAIQYGHMRTAVSAGYAARSRDGIHDLLDIETARATADTLVALHDDLAAGTGVSGPAARRAIHAAAQAPTFAGSIRTARQARAILHNPALTVHDNPHTYLMCVYNRDKALCHRLGARDTPTLDRCVSTCANIARTDHQADQLSAQAETLEKQAAAELVPEPLGDRLRHRAASLRDLAEQHYRNCITSQEATA